MFDVCLCCLCPLLSMRAGDLAPTYWATQLMLIVLLVLTFTLLPYLTSQLMDALLSTSVHQRRRWAPLQGLPVLLLWPLACTHSCCGCLGPVNASQARMCHLTRFDDPTISVDREPLRVLAGISPAGGQGCAMSSFWAPWTATPYRG
jgi:hypothetical protein